MAQKHILLGDDLNSKCIVIIDFPPIVESEKPLKYEMSCHMDL